MHRRCVGSLTKKEKYVYVSVCEYIYINIHSAVRTACTYDLFLMRPRTTMTSHYGSSGRADPLLCLGGNVPTLRSQRGGVNQIPNAPVGRW